jgi:hypothetical protein
VTCSYAAPMIAAAGTLARIRHTGDRSGLRRSTINPALMPPRGRSVRSPRVPSPLRLLVNAALLVARRVAWVKSAEGIASDGAAALDAVGAAWTITGRGGSLARRSLRRIRDPQRSKPRDLHECRLLPFARMRSFRTGPVRPEPTASQSAAMSRLWPAAERQTGCATVHSPHDRRYSPT